MSRFSPPSHRLRAGNTADPPLWTWPVRQEQSSALHSGSGRGNSKLCGLTIHSSRRRFAARLNSGVRPQRHTSWPRANLRIELLAGVGPRGKNIGASSPALRYISDLIHLRAVTDPWFQVACSNQDGAGNKSIAQRPNNSFKPRPLRGLGAGAMIGPSPRPLRCPA